MLEPSSEISQTIRVAKQQGLSAMPRNADGQVKSSTVNVSAYEVKDLFRRRTMPERVVSINVKESQTLSQIKKDLKSRSSLLENYSEADLLMKTGVLSPDRFATVLKIVLEDPRSSALEKMMILQSVRLPTAIFSIKDRRTSALSSFQKDRRTAQHCGLTSTDLERLLRYSAQYDSNGSVKYMAAGLLYGLKLGRINRWLGENVVNDINKMWLRSKGTESESRFGLQVIAYLVSATTDAANDMESQQSARGRRLAASQALDSCGFRIDEVCESVVNCCTDSNLMQYQTTAYL